MMGCRCAAAAYGAMPERTLCGSAQLGRGMPSSLMSCERQVGDSPFVLHWGRTC